MDARETQKCGIIRTRRRELDMSIMIDLPPVMAQEVKEYVTVRGTTLEQLFLDYLKTELKRWHEVDAVMVVESGVRRE